MVVHDFAYADLGFDGYKPPSILQVEGAKEVAVEIFSMSKSYNMAGWRVGFCLGNRKMIAALARIKSYLDYGVFQPIQIASIIALRECEEETAKICAIYQKRRDVLVNGLKRAGWPVEKPRGSMFLWAPLPERYRADGSLEFAKTAARKGAGGGLAGDRLRPAGRGLRAVRAGGERSAHPPGHAVDRAVFEAVGRAEPGHGLTAETRRRRGSAEKNKLNGLEVRSQRRPRARRVEAPVKLCGICNYVGVTRASNSPLARRM